MSLSSTRNDGEEGATARVSSSSALPPPTTPREVEVIVLDGDDVIEHRITESTRSSYERMLKNLGKEFDSNGQEDALFNEESQDGKVRRHFKVPMSLDHWKWILTKMAQPINEKGQVRALSTINGYINAQTRS